MTTQLPPNAHLLLSFINRGLPWAKVLAEFVDNAFDDAAGNSREVVIELHKGEVSITDYGRGIEDINRLGTLGASASYHHEGNIGQYGIGAKAWLCKAEKSECETETPKPKPRPKPRADLFDGLDSVGTGIRFRWQHLGHDTLGAVSLVGRSVTVTLNRDCPKLEAQSRQPKYPGLYLTIGNELAMKCTELTVSEIEDNFGAMLGSASGSEHKADMMRAIRVWWGFVAEEENNQADAA